MKMKRKKGSILAFAVILMSFMLVIAIALTFSSLRGRKSVDVSSNSTTAFQKTDKGMEVFLQELFKNSKPFDTLTELAKNMGSTNEYVCKNVSGENNKSTAVISGNDFKMVSYKLVNPESAENNSDSAVVEDCNTEIARISKIKVSGNFAGATRSLDINLNSSLDRGRIARWNFEDNARSIRQFGPGKGGPGAPEIRDSSKEGEYTLTLCPAEGGGALPYTNGSKNCPLLDPKDSTEETGFYMSHYPKWDEMDDSKPDDDGKCFAKGILQIPCGSYVAGIYFDGYSGLGAGKEVNPISYDLKPGDEGYYKKSGRSGSEALEFNGFSNFLAPNLDDPSNSATNYVKDAARKNLNLEGRDGFSISLWVNDDENTGNEEKEILVSKSKNNQSGYELYIEKDKIFFSVNGQKVSANFKDNKNEWHHIVARYDSGNNGGKDGILIDGEQVAVGLSGAGAIKDDDNTPLFIGGKYEGDKDKFDVEELEGAFGGMIDNVEIYNRYLIDFEAQVLCNMASGEDWRETNNRVAGKPCVPINW